MNLTPRMLLDDYPIRTSEKLRFADTDRNGHITNSVFAVCCQNARMELLCDPRRVPIPPDTQFVVARLLLEFRAEMHWPGTVEVGTRFDRIGRSSVTLDQALFVGDDCVATCHSVVVLIDASARRSTCLPAETVSALRAMTALNNPAGVGARSPSPEAIERLTRANLLLSGRLAIGVESSCNGHHWTRQWPGGIGHDGKRRS
jgi:acyl-CoA thioester hydrolase